MLGARQHRLEREELLWLSAGTEVARLVRWRCCSTASSDFYLLRLSQIPWNVAPVSMSWNRLPSLSRTMRYIRTYVPTGHICPVLSACESSRSLAGLVDTSTLAPCRTSARKKPVDERGGEIVSCPGTKAARHSALVHVHVKASSSADAGKDRGLGRQLGQARRPGLERLTDK